MRCVFLMVVCCCGFTFVAMGEVKSIGVFVALADNEHQGIVPVPNAIGDGEDPGRNLYWGAGEGLKGVFDKSPAWRLSEKSDTPNEEKVLCTRVYTHKNTGARLTAKAYKGEKIAQCLQDFEKAIQSDAYDLVVYIGHNGLMDFELPLAPTTDAPGKKPDCIVLCCKSDAYFKDRIVMLGGCPILLTTQFMYPGSFLLREVAESWLSGSSLQAIRNAAGMAYAQNQKLSEKAGKGVFADLKECP